MRFWYKIILQKLIEPIANYDIDRSLVSGGDFNCTSSVLDRTRSSFETYLKHSDRNMSCDFVTLSVTKSIIRQLRSVQVFVGSTGDHSQVQIVQSKKINH